MKSHLSSHIRELLPTLLQQLTEQHDFIHVLTGPRQVGKTTAVHQLMDRLPKSAGHIRYISADGEIQRPSSWLTEQWAEFRPTTTHGLLIIDEIQKVENWSEKVKEFWDPERRKPPRERMRLLLLGSSSLMLQQGLSESLAGRYIVHPVRHWGFAESHEAFGLSLEEYLRFGGYPASYAFIKKPHEWVAYVRDSIINPVLGRDILSLARVKSPALFRQCFDIACAYAARELSYTKLLGQLQDKGNTDLVKHYLELFEAAFLIRQLHKYSPKTTLARASSPKLLPLCPALYSITLQADLDDSDRGRAFELMIGAELAALPGDLYYWREKDFEVDYVLRYGKKVWAVEVKYTATNSDTSRGLDRFLSTHPGALPRVITPRNYQTVLTEIRKAIGME